MNNWAKILQKIFIFEKEPQKVGLSQLKKGIQEKKQPAPSLKNKNVKLSDLMRRAS